MSGTSYVGRTIDDRYHIVQLLGKGGMGSVYLGQHIVIGKQVAVKFLHAEFAGHEEVVKRFYREAQAAAEIGHKNIIDVMDVGVSSDGEPYLVMEYLEGESLARMLERTGPIDLAAACGILEPILLALASAHEKGIVHRDLKPENIFLVHQPEETPTVKLIDFGISKFMRSTGQPNLTRTGALLGTPAYMSPEQARGASDTDHRADLYSVGVILYEMLTGELPFEGEHQNQLLINVLTADPKPPREVYNAFPTEAEPLVMQTLNKNPATRPQTAIDMLNTVKSLSEFEKRQERLTHFASGITKKSFAGGDLGESVSGEDSGGIAADVYAQLAREGTPKHRTKATLSTRGRLAILGVFVVVIVAIAIGIAIGISMFSPSSDRKSVKQEAAVVPLYNERVVPPPPSKAEKEAVTKPESVQIEVKDAPQGAKIYYDKAPVPMNPFKVDLKDTVTQLKIEAQGYETFITSVVPSQDRVVTVKMMPREKPRENSKTQRPGKKKPKEIIKKTVPLATSNSAQESKEEKKKFRTGKRGTKFGDEFE